MSSTAGNAGTPTFRLRLRVPRQVEIRSGQAAPVTLDRERFSEWLWARFGSSGLLGIHEGTLLADEASEQGLEMESWMVDAAEAPRERDWIGAQAEVCSELYFASAEAASHAKAILTNAATLPVGEVEEQPSEDWDAQWKASFLNAREGFPIPPFWRILPAWVEDAPPGAGERILRINPGAGFGTGTHETTQLCLQALAEILAPAGGAPVPVLDFGSGSGILAVGAALLGARVDAVEIDPLALDNAGENARINGVENKIRFSRELDPDGAPGRYDVVVANILRPVLLEHAERLVRALRPGGRVVLSGLIEGDVAEVEARYSSLLGSRRPLRRALAEWRSLAW